MAEQNLCFERRITVMYLPSKATISARIFLPSQLTVTMLPSLYSKLLSKISGVGAIPVPISCGKYSNAFDGRLLVSLHSCVRDVFMDFSTRA